MKDTAPVLLLSLGFATPVFAQNAPPAPPTTDQMYSHTIGNGGCHAPFDLVVTEIKREPDKSYLSVPGFHQRIAAGARMLMCAYTDLAIKRGFAHWVAQYPPSDSDVIVVGLTNATDARASEMFGNGYDESRSVGPVSVEKFRHFCGMSD